MALAKFIAFHEMAEPLLSRGRELKFALMLARAPQGVVLVFNLWRKVWELPGGLIDPGENPRRSAERELWEEAGCLAQKTRCLGVVEINDGHTHFGAVFGCEVRQADPAYTSEETGGLGFWLPGQFPQPLGHTDAGVLRKFG